MRNTNAHAENRSFGTGSTLALKPKGRMPRKSPPSDPSFAGSEPPHDQPPLQPQKTLRCAPLPPMQELCLATWERFELPPRYDLCSSGSVEGSVWASKTTAQLRALPIINSLYSCICYPTNLAPWAVGRAHALWNSRSPAQFKRPFLKCSFRLGGFGSAIEKRNLNRTLG